MCYLNAVHGRSSQIIKFILYILVFAYETFDAQCKIEFPTHFSRSLSFRISGSSGVTTNMHSWTFIWHFNTLGTPCRGNAYKSSRYTRLPITSRVKIYLYGQEISICYYLRFWKLHKKTSPPFSVILSSWELVTELVTVDAIAAKASVKMIELNVIFIFLPKSGKNPLNSKKKWNGLVKLA